MGKKLYLNIEPLNAETLKWDPANVFSSLGGVFTYAESVADQAISWYLRHKRWKARFSRTFQLVALTATALAGLLPVLVQVFGIQIGANANTGLWSAALVGLAASVIGLDKAFGFSSGWARYVLTATTMRKALQEFRVDWTLLLAQAGEKPSAEDILKLINRAKDFCVLIEGLVLQETKDWVTEFQSNMAQLEKETKEQLDALKAQVEKSSAAQAAASQPGSVEISVPNADKADNFTFQILLEGTQGKIAEDTVKNTKEWIRLQIIPGQYIGTVTASSTGKPFVKKQVLTVKPGEHSKVDGTLPF
jgi:hypothetical protein